MFAILPGFSFIQMFHFQYASNLHERVDFVACLGGDDVILHASNLFSGAIPPMVSFNLGSLVFRTPHHFADFPRDLKSIIHGNITEDEVYITLRMRLGNGIFRNGKVVPGKVFDVLDEVVIDRGSNPYLCKIECYGRNHLITKVQAKGVIVATLTGSTTYSTSVGGSMVHPNVPCMIFTPICPHSLSFRHVILPASAQLELRISGNARRNSWVLFEGKKWQQLSKGDSVCVYMSEQQHHFPIINECNQTDECFQKNQICATYDADDGIRSVLHMMMMMMMMMMDLLGAKSKVKKSTALRESQYSEVGNGQVSTISAFCEEDQENLCNLVQDKSATGKQGIGICDKPKKIAGVHWRDRRSLLIQAKTKRNAMLMKKILSKL